MSRVLTSLKQHIEPGKVYRRADLELWSNAVDRHLHLLTVDGTLKKLGKGMYYAPKETKFGLAPPSEHALVERFLKDDAFLLMTPNAYNSLGLGTTQLYNATWVYNHKRKGKFKLGGKELLFQLKSSFPSTLSEAYLLVDFLNNIDALAEDSDLILANLEKSKNRFNSYELMEMARRYGTAETRKKILSIARAAIKNSGKK